MRTTCTSLSTSKTIDLTLSPPAKMPRGQLAEKGIYSDPDSSDSDLSELSDGRWKDGERRVAEQKNRQPKSGKAKSKTGITTTQTSTMAELNTALSKRAEDAWFPDPEPPRKLHKPNSSAFNIHALPRQPRPPILMYGKNGMRSANMNRSAKDQKEKKSSGFKLPSNMSSRETRSSPRRVFKLPTKQTQQHDSDSDRVGFVLPSSVLSAPRPTGKLDPADEALLAGDVELEKLDDSELNDLHCDLCATPIDPEVKERFEDEYNLEKGWNYKWKTRFCEYHRRYEGRQAWKDKGYPNIDWDGLPERLHQPDHVVRIKSILEGQRRSQYQSIQEELVKSRNKTTQQIFDAGTTRRGGAGYYGFRGERLLSEHIMQHFGDDLRAHATKDKVIAASGVSGGLSGFVNAVLVPELAVGLIIEDMDKSEAEAMDILNDSADIGDVMHPELDDRTRESDNDDSDG